MVVVLGKRPVDIAQRKIVAVSDGSRISCISLDKMPDSTDRNACPGDTGLAVLLLGIALDARYDLGHALFVVWGGSYKTLWPGRSGEKMPEHDSHGHSFAIGSTEKAENYPLRSYWQKVFSKPYQ